MEAKTFSYSTYRPAYTPIRKPMAKKKFNLKKYLNKTTAFFALTAAFTGAVAYEFNQPSAIPTPVKKTVTVTQAKTIPVHHQAIVSKPTSAAVDSGAEVYQQVQATFHEGNEANITAIRDDSVQYGIPVWLSLGIAHTESHFNTSALGPNCWMKKRVNGTIEKVYLGRAVGEFQIINSTATEILHVDPSILYNHAENVRQGVRLLSIYLDWFIHGTANAPTEFKAFHPGYYDGKVCVYYNNTPVLDQNGQIVDPMLLAVLAYNGGPWTILYDMRDDGKLIMDPYSSNCNVSLQSLDYALKVNDVYRFNYNFSYTEKAFENVNVLNY